jgi:hypothetical protein
MSLLRLFLLVPAPLFDSISDGVAVDIHIHATSGLHFDLHRPLVLDGLSRVIIHARSFSIDPDYGPSRFSGASLGICRGSIAATRSEQQEAGDGRRNTEGITTIHNLCPFLAIFSLNRAMPGGKRNLLPLAL